MVQYKLSYFNGKGLGEITRYIFALAGIEYEDHIILEEDWPKIKPTTPFGHVPVLEITDGSHVEYIAQSNTIARSLNFLIFIVRY